MVTQPCWRPIRYGCAAPSQSCPIGARCRNHHTRNRTPMNPGRWLGRCVSIGAACGVFSNHDAAALGPGRRPIVAPKGGWLCPRHCGVLEALVRRRVRSSPRPHSSVRPLGSASIRRRSFARGCRWLWRSKSRTPATEPGASVLLWRTHSLRDAQLTRRTHTNRTSNRFIGSA